VNDSSRRGASVSRAVVCLLLLASFCMALATAECADAADAPREVHGMSDAIATPDVALAWAFFVARAKRPRPLSSASSLTRRSTAGWVVGIDPFSKQEQPLRPVAANPEPLMCARRGPVRGFSAYRVSVVRFRNGRRSGTPALVVFYRRRARYDARVRHRDKLQAYLLIALHDCAAARGAKRDDARNSPPARSPVLKPEVTERDIRTGADLVRALRIGFYCVQPCWVKLATDAIGADGARVVSVVGFARMRPPRG